MREPGGSRDGRGVRLSPVVIGRADLLSLTGRRWQAAIEGAGQLLFLAGEAGIGKTRLLRELAASVRAEGASVVVAAAFPPDAQTAGGVLVDLASSARRAADPAIAAAGQALADRLRDVPAADDGDAHRRRRLLVADLADGVLEMATGAAPPLVCLEDLHWADDLTLQVLDRVSQHLPGSRMLVVGSYRSDELYPQVPMRQWRARLLNQRRAEEVRLSRLGRDDVARLCEAITGAVLPAALVDLVADRSDGIPLHVEELLATLSTSEDPSATVPETLADAVLSRARALTPAARELAEAAAVIGRSFEPDLLAAIAGFAGRGDATADALRELVEQYVVEDRADRYEFRHALIRDALYVDLPASRRRALHRRVAQTAVAAGGFGHAFISTHFEQAREPAEAYRHARVAAAEATALSAHREAVDLLRRAQRTAPVAIPVGERAAMLVELATELAATDDNRAAAACFAQAHDLLRADGDETGAAALVPAWVAVRHLLGAALEERTGQLRVALSRLGEGERPVQGRLEAALAAAYMLSRRLDESIECGERARRLLGADDPALLHVDTTLGSVLVFAGRMDEGWRLLEDAAARALETGTEAEAARAYRMIGSAASVLVEYGRADHWLRQGIAYAERTERWNDRHYMAAHLAHVLWATGEWTEAWREAQQALADGRGGITTRITALHVLGYLALGRGEHEEARDWLMEARELGERMDELQRLSPALWGLAESCLLSGERSQAIAWCERGHQASAEVGDAAYLFPYVVTGVRARLAADDLTGARDWLERCEPLLRRRRIPGTLAALEHGRGLLQLTAGRTGQAREALSSASAGWERSGRFWEGAHAQLDLARCALRSRRPGDVPVLVEGVRERAARAGATPLLSAAEAIGQAGARAGGTGAARAGGATGVHAPLSAREFEVARLIASGATNRQIAAALHIAPKTVSAHVEHILTKLGAGRRAEIAAWAATH